MIFRKDTCPGEMPSFKKLTEQVYQKLGESYVNVGPTADPW
jgi:hypothetical protein